MLCLKPLDPFGKHSCPRPTLRVSQLLYQITNLWKFRLNRSSESGENNGNTHSCPMALNVLHWGTGMGTQSTISMCVCVCFSLKCDTNRHQNTRQPNPQTSKHCPPKTKKLTKTYLVEQHRIRRWTMNVLH